MARDNSNRTEKPTSRRITEARKRGQIARSRDLGQAASLAAALWVLTAAGPFMVGRLANGIREAIRRMSGMSVRDIDAAELSSLALDTTGAFLWLVAPVAGAVALSTFSVQIAQGGWNFAPETLKLNWSRLNPANGLQRLGFSRAGLDLVKMLIATAAIAYISVKAVQAMLGESVQLARVTPPRAALEAWMATERLLRTSAMAMGLIAVADYGVQRWRLTQSLKMTKEEVRDDTRMTEGNPEIKARVRRVQREMMRRRMLRAAAHATLVVTNPTEYAVALEYQRHLMPAPRVVAKGRGFLAARIKAIAREHGVPLVENVALAQALYKGVEVGDTIPGSLFKAVAELLAYLIRLKQIAL